MKGAFKRIPGLIMIGILVLLWEFYAQMNPDFVFLPAFSEIVLTLLTNLVNLDFLSHIGWTMGRCLVGFSTALLIMIPLGVLMGRNSFIYFLFEPIVEFFRPMPSAAIIPIAILFLGIDNEMKLFIIFFGSSWPILINTIQGVQSVEPLYVKTGQVFNLSKRDILTKIVFPASLPSIFAGLRISVAIALILSITVEMIVTTGKGIGYYILDAERSFHFAEMYAGVLTIGIIGYLVNYILLKISKNQIDWNK